MRRKRLSRRRDASRQQTAQSDGLEDCDATPKALTVMGVLRDHRRRLTEPVRVEI
jgi:hypothetical protein